MDKLDLKKRYPAYYTAKNKPELNEVAAAQYLSILGKGDPSSTAYAERVQALFSVAYGVKFACKEKKQDFVVSKLEGLWWFDETKFGQVGMSEAPQAIPRSEWEWRMLIRIPEFVLAPIVDPVIEKVVVQKGLPLGREVTFFSTPAELVVQMMHLGPFDREPETLAQMMIFIEKEGLKKAGPHHEIYLSDITRAAPEKWKTILREPVVKGSPNHDD